MKATRPRNQRATIGTADGLTEWHAGRTPLPSGRRRAGGSTLPGMAFIAGVFGFLANTEIVSGGADVRVALFEGFRESIPGFIPDLGVGGGVRTITGTSEFKPTIASFDAELSQPLPIAGTVVLQPHVGYQWVRIFGD